jgi:hypothetical protein
VTYTKDVGWLLLIGLLLPLLMALAVAGLVVIVARHLYWWARGNTTAASRRRGRPRLSWAERRSSWSGWRSSWFRGTTAPMQVAPPVTAPSAPIVTLEPCLAAGIVPHEGRYVSSAGRLGSPLSIAFRADRQPLTLRGQSGKERRGSIDDGRERRSFSKPPASAGSGDGPSRVAGVLDVFATNGAPLSETKME